FRTAIAICFDLRFPSLFLTLAYRGAELFLLPSAFMATTGKYHWEVLLRARAIENQCYVVAANQFGMHPNGVTTFGHSLIINPWGQVIAGVPKGEGTAVASIDKRFLRQVRKKIPLYGDFTLSRGERREAR
ncbi:MAG: nitrilase-related carbon-nitrogen hydrolase, partial [Candidatus Brocadiales bacterium]